MSDVFEANVSCIELDNQSGTVCSLECYCKENESDKPKRVGNTSTFPVGKSRSLDLDSLKNEGLEPGMFVTAYANVRAGKDDHADIWVKYEPSTKSKATYIISGVINFTKVAFEGTSTI